MEQVTLEVGKTYEVRSPEKVKSEGEPTIVKIVRDALDGTTYPFQGDNGCWYTKDGRFAGDEYAFDLVKEVPNEKGV